MSSSRLDPREQPPAALKDVFKKYQKMKAEDVLADEQILDFTRRDLFSGLEIQGKLTPENLRPVFRSFVGDESIGFEDFKDFEDVPFYTFKPLPGLLIFPSLLPAIIQKVLLNRLLHRDLADPKHMTNVHAHYDVPYPEEDASPTCESASFFSLPSQSIFWPKDPEVHKPLSVSKVLEKSLRWVTLGGQYDWTNKVYPEEVPPEFPVDIGDLLHGIFPEMTPQAAIVNLYTPGDTLSLHRDVSEQSEKGLVSISLGCDCLFVLGLGKDPSDSLIIRLRSGDGILMSDSARFAWHGVPRILRETCPSYLSTWPAESGKYENWKDWMTNKRINLNVRQMRD